MFYSLSLLGRWQLATTLHGLSKRSPQPQRGKSNPEKIQAIVWHTSHARRKVLVHAWEVET